MNPIRERAKNHFPMVLLTLLSIFQGLALELLWSKAVELPHLYTDFSSAWLGWLQILTTLLGIILIWIVYASNVMRFRWVPKTSDSIIPFIIGTEEFILIEMLQPGIEGYWLFGMGGLVIMTTFTMHITMRQARLDEDNAIFFEDVEPATIKDFLSQIVFAAFLFIAGLVVQFGGGYNLAAFSTLIVLAFLLYQFKVSAYFWSESMSETEQTNSQQLKSK